MSDLRERQDARRQAEELGLVWPSRGEIRDLLDDALATGGLIRIHPGTGNAGTWTVTAVAECDRPDSLMAPAGHACDEYGCAGVADLYQERGWGSSAQHLGQHIPLNAVVEVA